MHEINLTDVFQRNVCPSFYCIQGIWEKTLHFVIFQYDPFSASSHTSCAILSGLKMTRQPMRSGFKSCKVSCHPSPKLYENMEYLTIPEQAHGSRLMNGINKALMWRSTSHLHCHCSELRSLEEKLLSQERSKRGSNQGTFKGRLSNIQPKYLCPHKNVMAEALLFLFCQNWHKIQNIYKT